MRFGFAVLILFLSSWSLGQKTKLLFEVEDAQGIPDKLLKPIAVYSASSIENALQNRYIDWKMAGYYFVKMEVVKKDSLEITYHVTPNQHLETASFCFNENTLKLLQENGWMRHSKSACFETNNPQKIAYSCQQLLSLATENGYPFARIELHPTIIENHVECTIDLWLGPFTFWEDLVVKGDSSLSKGVTAQLIGFKSGSPFNQREFEEMDKRMDQATYLQRLKPTELLFTEKGVTVFTYFQSKKISSVQGAVGLQPNPNTQRMTLTGDAQLHLVNVMKRAEQLDLNWRSIQAQTQSLLVKFIYPYLFQTPFGVDAKFFLYKRDTTFIEVNATLGATYSLRNGATIKASYAYQLSSLLRATGVSTSGMADITTNAYSIGFSQRKVNYVPNPYKGFVVNLSAAVGNRTAKTDSISKNLTGRIAIKWENYLGFLKRNVLKTAIHSELYFAPSYFKNERYRFGGLNSFRGFNEDQLSGTKYAILTAEYRYLLDKNSNVFVYYDQAIFFDETSNLNWQTPRSIGLGFSFGTKIGIFTVSYAVGQYPPQAFSVRESKIHFGYSAFF